MVAFYIAVDKAFLPSFHVCCVFSNGSLEKAANNGTIEAGKILVLYLLD